MSAEAAPLKFVPLVAGVTPMMNCAGETEDGAINNLLDYLDDPDYESWEDLQFDGYTIELIDDVQTKAKPGVI